MRAYCDRGISRVGRGSGLPGAATSLFRTGAGDKIGSTRGFRADCSAEGADSETDGATRRRFGVKSASAAARARDPLTIITAKVVLLLPAIEQESPDCLPARDIEVEFVNFGKSLPHLLGAVPRQSRITPDSGKLPMEIAYTAPQSFNPCDARNGRMYALRLFSK
jgi:hypothetical protein